MLKQKLLQKINQIYDLSLISSPVNDSKTSHPSVNIISDQSKNLNYQYTLAGVRDPPKRGRFV